MNSKAQLLDVSLNHRCSPICRVMLWIGLSGFLCGCQTVTNKRTHWDEWREGQWQGAGEQSATVRIESIPGEADVFVDNRRYGQTPLQIRLPYSLQTRVDERSLYRTTTAYDAFGPLQSASREDTVEIDRQVRTEQRDVEQTAQVTAQKNGYFPAHFTISVPRDANRSLIIRLAPLQILSIQSVTVDDSVKRQTGPFRWLRDHVFFRSAIRGDQYIKLTDRIGRVVAGRLAETAIFTVVTRASSTNSRGSVATLRLHARPERQALYLTAHLASKAVLGNRVITRETSVPMRTFEANLNSGCKRLADQLLEPYQAALSQQSQIVRQ